MDLGVYSKHNTITRAERAFVVLASIFIASLVLTNIIAGRYFTFLGLPLSCSVLVYPITFLVTDIVSEVYGPGRARMLVLIGLVVSILVAALVWIANQLPADAASPVDQASFSQLFGLLPGIVLGSMAAYLTAQFVDVYVFEYLRKVANKKHLWLRNNGSTLCSQLVDTAMVVTISLVLWPLVDGNAQTYPISWQLWLKIVTGQYFFKGVLALLDTPFVYAGIYLTQRWIGLQPN